MKKRRLPAASRTRPPARPEPRAEDETREATKTGFVTLKPLQPKLAAWACSIAVWWLSALLLTQSGKVRADEPRLVLMREPTPYTDVIDAADVHDAFDLNVHLGYSRVRDRGLVQREVSTPEGGRRASLAAAERVVSQLMLGADIGLYRDVMAFVRVPLVLDDSRRLTRASGVSEQEASELLADPATGGRSFDVPTYSAPRAGFDYVGLGGAAAITNQERKPWLPTWVVLVEGRRAVGRLHRPCREEQTGDEAIVCGGTEGSLTTPASKKGASGVSRGVSALLIETRVSKRIRFAEPYAGLGALIEWASTAKKTFDVGGGFKKTAPSRQLSFTLGSELIAWEHRGRFQRIALDARFLATYFTAGRDYSMLYDALGTAEGASHPLRGLTDMGERTKLGGRLGVDIRAARYVRFSFGAGLSAMTAHLLSASAACPSGASASRAQSACAADRPAIDAPGRRFWMTRELLFDLYAAATAHF